MVHFDESVDLASHLVAHTVKSQFVPRPDPMPRIFAHQTKEAKNRICKPQSQRKRILLPHLRTSFDSLPRKLARLAGNPGIPSGDLDSSKRFCNAWSKRSELEHLFLSPTAFIASINF